MANIHRIVCGNANCYIVESGNNAILVDTSQIKYREKILSACEPYNIRLIVLTHGHFDHSQNAAYLSEKLNAPIAIHKADEKLIKDNMAQELYAHTFLGKIVLSASIKGFKDRLPEFKASVFLKDGDSLENYGIPAKIVALAGHTDGSIGIDIEGKYLIVGDALMNMFYPTVSMLYHDKAQMLESAKKISNIGERTIFFGHGKPKYNKQWV